MIFLCPKKNFLAEHAHRAPSLQYIGKSNLSFCAHTFKTSRYALVTFLNGPKREFIKTAEKNSARYRDK